jgi:hypothetical protein
MVYSKEKEGWERGALLRRKERWDIYKRDAYRRTRAPLW